MSHTETLTEKYRHINVEHDWWDGAYEHFCYKLDTLGIGVTPEDISFSGFWSQGDGLSFTGYIHRDNMKQFMEEHALHLEYPACYFFAKQRELGGKLVRTTSHYCHENTVQFELNDDYIVNEYDEDNPREQIYEAMVKAFNQEYKEFEEACQKICRGWMKIFYNELESEYEALTSDEAVMETIVANNLLNEEGDDYGVCSDQR